MARFVHLRQPMIDPTITRRDAIRRLLSTAVIGGLPLPIQACNGAPDEPGGDLFPPAGEERSAGDPRDPTIGEEDLQRLIQWTQTLRTEGFGSPERDFGLAAARVGELAIGTPYEGSTLEAYIRAGGSPSRTEPLTLSLTRFDCVSLVEACLAIARIARGGEQPSWEVFGREMERMRYRDGIRGGYASRLHYFSDWLADNERRGLVQLIGRELGGIADDRPLRFMSSNPDSYPALAVPEVRGEIAATERALDGQSRWVVPTNQISTITRELRTGDILGFATSIAGLDVTHAAFAYGDGGDVLRVLHAPLSGGVVEITRSTVPQYVSAIRQATGILVARPLQG
jgi:hypothetical protein